MGTRRPRCVSTVAPPIFQSPLRVTSSVITLLLSPVFYSVSVLDLKIVKWEPGKHYFSRHGGGPMLRYSRFWWMVVLRGVLLLLLGVAALRWPGATLAVLVLWIGAGFLVNGVFALVAALAGRDVEGRGWLVLEGALGVLAGLVTLMNPGFTGIVLLWLLAGWAILSGIIQVVAAVRFRRVIRGELFLGLAGVLAILFGVLLVARPAAGLVALAFLLGWFAIFYGVVLIALGLRLRRLLRELEQRVAAPAR
ncbi:MAG: HdeD family acid-resistance protein [Gemmatimonadales bacterium]